MKPPEFYISHGVAEITYNTMATGASLETRQLWKKVWRRGKNEFNIEKKKKSARNMSVTYAIKHKATTNKNEKKKFVAPNT